MFVHEDTATEKPDYRRATHAIVNAIEQRCEQLADVGG